MSSLHALRDRYMLKRNWFRQISMYREQAERTERKNVRCLHVVVGVLVLLPPSPSPRCCLCERTLRQ